MEFYQISYCVEVDGNQKFRGDAIMSSENKDRDILIFREMVIDGYHTTFQNALIVTVTIFTVTDMKCLSPVKCLAMVPIISN